jgi:hypothetical protein
MSPLILAASLAEARTCQPDTEIWLVDSPTDPEGEEVPLVCPDPKKDFKSALELYYDLIINSIFISKDLKSDQELLIADNDGIVFSPALAIALRCYFYNYDYALAIASQVAQRPQCQPSPEIIAVADSLFDLEGKLSQALEEYLATGLAISSNGQSFWHDPNGIGEEDV